MKSAEKEWKVSPPAVVRIVRPRRNGTPVAVQVDPALNQPLGALAERIFFPVNAPERRRVLFLGADRDTNVIRICERLAETVVQLTGNLVGIASEKCQPLSAGKKQARSVQGEEEWRNICAPLTEKVWQVPLGLFLDLQSARQERATLAAEIDANFGYLLFPARSTDGQSHRLAIPCDGVVLVLTANRTRRQVAQRTIEELPHWNTPLLGTILDERQFPVPDAIYHAL